MRIEGPATPAPTPDMGGKATATAKQAAVYTVLTHLQMILGALQSKGTPRE